LIIIDIVHIVQEIKTNIKNYNKITRKSFKSVKITNIKYDRHRNSQKLNKSIGPYENYTKIHIQTIGIAVINTMNKKRAPQSNTLILFM